MCVPIVLNPINLRDIMRGPKQTASSIVVDFQRCCRNRRYQPQSPLPRATLHPKYGLTLSNTIDLTHSILPIMVWRDGKLNLIARTTSPITSCILHTYIYLSTLRLIWTCRLIEFIIKRIVFILPCFSGQQCYCPMHVMHNRDTVWRHKSLTLLDLSGNKKIKQHSNDVDKMSTMILYLLCASARSVCVCKSSWYVVVHGCTPASAGNSGTICQRQRHHHRYGKRPWKVFLFIIINTNW